MKKLLPTFLLMSTMACTGLHAQIPNNGFENWTNAGSYDDPNQWTTINAYTSLVSVYTCTKGTPGNPGNSYIKLTSQNTLVGVAPGVATTGSINTSTFTAFGGFPYTQMPQSLTGTWQYMASGSDQGYIAVAFTKWNTGTNSRDTVAWALHNLPGMAMSWTNFTIPLTWNMLTAPDSANIILSASGANGLTPAAGSYLYVDNLAFAGSVGIGENAASSRSLHVFPSPAAANVNVEFTAANAEKTKVEIIDVTGKVAKEISVDAQKGQNKVIIETNDISSGIYFVRVGKGDMARVKKLIIE